MWRTKEFKTREEMNEWLEKNRHRIQYEELFIEGGYCIEYRLLRVIDFGDEDDITE